MYTWLQQIKQNGLFGTLFDLIDKSYSTLTLLEAYLHCPKLLLFYLYWEQEVTERGNHEVSYYTNAVTLYCGLILHMVSAVSKHHVFYSGAAEGT